MAENASDVAPNGADVIDDAALFDLDLDDLFRIKAKIDGCILKKLGDAHRSEAFRDDGATSPEAWVVERFGVSTATARAYTHVGEKASGMPHLRRIASCEGDLSFDKVRTLADVATPGIDRELCDQAKQCSVRELADIARSKAELTRTRSLPRARLRARWSLLALQRHVPHHQRPTAGRFIRRDEGLASRPGPRRSLPTGRHRGTSVWLTPSWS